MRALWTASALVLAASSPALAITWTDVERSDPFAQDGACDAHEPMSYGSYIYQYESKYELVFWPFTDPMWIWRCPESGFVSFGSHFDAVTDEERPRIAALLERWRAEGAPTGRMTALEEIYRVRDDVDWSWLNRVLAQWHVENPERADAYRAAAVPLLEAKLPDAEGPARIELLYLLGAYALRSGEAEASAAYFAEARAVEWTDDEGESRVGVPYINGVIDEVEAGALDEHWGPRTP